MRRHLLTISVLVCASALAQAWLLARTVVPSQDAVRVVALAAQLEAQGLPALAAEDEAAYALVVGLVHRLRCRTLGADPASWGTSVQLTAAVAVVAVSVPLYALLASLVVARAALSGALAFSVCGATPLLGADGLVDAWHLLLIVSALALLSRAAARGWQAGAALAFGGCLGAALLLRPEAVLAGVAAFSAALAIEVMRRGRAAARHALIAAIGLAVVPIAFWSLTDSLGPLGRVVDLASPTQRPPSAAAVDAAHRDEILAAARGRLPDGEPWSLAAKERSASRRTYGWRTGLLEVMQEIVPAVGLPILLLAAAGLAVGRRHVLDAAAFMPPSAIALIVIAAGLWMAATAGYLSSRHLVLAGVPAFALAGCGAVALVETFCQRAIVRATAIAVLAAVVAVPMLVERPHASRAAHRAAGLWLRRCATEGRVLDTRGWTSLFSGRPTYGYADAERAWFDPELRYVVVERRELAAQSPRASTLGHLLKNGGTLLAAFPLAGAAPTKTVEIYGWRGLSAAQLAHLRQPGAMRDK